MIRYKVIAKDILGEVRETFIRAKNEKEAKHLVLAAYGVFEWEIVSIEIDQLLIVI